MRLKKIITEELAKGKEFGVQIMIYDIMARFTEQSWFYEKKHKAILRYLKTKYQPVLDKYKEKAKEECGDIIESTCPIWVYWDQGFEKAPTLVKVCLDSLKRVSKQHPVIELSAENYEHYIVLPQIIKEKKKNGKICIAHFSDILRVSLLAKYGGVWADATLYFDDWIKEDLREMLWYSVKTTSTIKNPLYISQYRWSSFFQICGRKNIIAAYMQEIFFEYWRQENLAIDYFLLDYFLYLGYSEIEEITAMIDAVPNNNGNINYLSRHLNDWYDNQKFRKVSESTALFKLNWRMSPVVAPGTYAHELLGIR